MGRGGLLACPRALEARGVDGYEAYAVAGGQVARRVELGVEQAEWGAPEQVPAAWRGDAVDAALAAGDSDRAGGHARAGRGQPGQGQPLRQLAEVAVAGREAGHVDAVGVLGVQ